MMLVTYIFIPFILFIRFAHTVNHSTILMTAHPYILLLLIRHL